MTEKQINKLPVLLTVKEMAEVLKITKVTAYRIIRKRDVNVLKIAPNKIRIPKYELLKWIKENE